MKYTADFYSDITIIRCKDCMLLVDGKCLPRPANYISKANINREKPSYCPLQSIKEGAKATTTPTPKRPAESTKTAYTVTISAQAYKKLVFLQKYNYFEELTESEVIENIINTTFAEYQEVFERELR